MKHPMYLLVLCAPLFLFACSSSDSGSQAGGDGGSSDASVTDASVADGMGADGGGPDANECTASGTALVCKEGSIDVYNSDECGDATTVATVCDVASPCAVNSGDSQAYCSCPLTGTTACVLGGETSTLYEETFIIKERECINAVADPADIVENCEFGAVCFEDAAFNGGIALCNRSVDASQSSKPYYNHSCGISSVFQSNPSKLEMDCRCRITGDGQGGAGGSVGTGNGYVDPNIVDSQDTAYFPGGPIINCATPSAMAMAEWAVSYGTGPSFNAWLQQNSSGASWFSADVDATSREMFAIVKWTNSDYSNSATVVAWNIDTGNRRVVSGLYPGDAGQETFGSGYMSPALGGTVSVQPLSGANVLRIGPDGMLYTYGGGTGTSSSSTREIVRIHPTTGERTLVWLAQDAATGDITASYGQCFRPDAYGVEQSIAFASQAFEVGPDGTFYLSMNGLREGNGIIAIAANGSSCTYLSRWGGIGHAPGGGVTPVPAPTQIGSGFVLQSVVRGLLMHEASVYGASDNDLYSFNVSTGDRARQTYTTGTYDRLGFANMFWDATREVIWAVGDVASYTGTIVDLTTGRREPIYADSEWAAAAILQSDYSVARSVSPSMLTNGNSIHYGGLILDPTNSDIVFAVLQSGGLMKMELSTFNNFVYSW